MAYWIIDRDGRHQRAEIKALLAAHCINYGIVWRFSLSATSLEIGVGEAAEMLRRPRMLAQITRISDRSPLKSRRELLDAEVENVWANVAPVGKLTLERLATIGELLAWIDIERQKIWADGDPPRLLPPCFSPEEFLKKPELSINENWLELEENPEIKRKIFEMLDVGEFSQRGIARALGIRHQVVQRIAAIRKNGRPLRGSGRKLSPRRRDQALAKASQRGASVKAVADEFGISPNHLYRMLKTHREKLDRQLREPVEPRSSTPSGRDEPG